MPLDPLRTRAAHVVKLWSIAAVHYDAYEFSAKGESTHPQTPRLAISGYPKEQLGGIVVRGRTPDPPFLKLIFGLREGGNFQGAFFRVSPGPYGMWHENAISHPPREVELG